MSSWSVLRKKRTIVVCCFLVVCVIFIRNIVDDTKATWRNTIMMKLKKYQIELQQTIDFSSSSLAENMTYAISNLNKNKRHKQPAGLVKSDVESLNDVNKLFKTSRQCVQRSRHQLALFLHKEFEAEFVTDYKRKETHVSPVLEPYCQPGIDLIIVLTSRPGAFFNRVAIRNSWGRIDSEINKHIFKDSSFRYQTIYTLGRDSSTKVEKLIEFESQNFQDILRLDYEDSYDNLTNKTMLTLEWLANNCKAKYVLKTDDDCFVNIMAISLWLPRLKPGIKYIGKKNDYMPIIRDPLHRNYVSLQDLKGEFYKPYCSGGGYMLAGDILKNITVQSKLIKQIINEDAYLGMVAYALNIKPTDDPRFLPFIFTKKSVNKRFMCDWKDQFLMHGVKAEKQLVMHWNALAMINYPSLCEMVPRSFR